MLKEKRRRAVITGIGVLSPLGNEKETFFSSLIKGKSGIRYINHFDTSSFPIKIGGTVEDFDPLLYLDKKEISRSDRFTQFATAATLMALKDANLDLEKEDKTKIGVYIGSGIGGLARWEEQHKILCEKGPSKVTPFILPMHLINMASGKISIMLGLQGPNLGIVTACATGNHSIGEAYRVIERGEADIMITGGSEAPITPFGVASFYSVRALSTRDCPPEEASCPFDIRRDGFVISEGAGILILEELNHALARNAHIYAELVGYGNSADAYHPTQPAPDCKGVVLALQRALDDAGIKKEEVDYINAHGTSTPLGDYYETLAIKQVFGEYAYKLKISSSKSMLGHLLGAAGAVETVACCLMLERKILHPTINYKEPDPKCDLDYLTKGAVEMPNLRIILNSSFAFGGQNAVLVLKSYDENQEITRG
jgi:3-oxoacyl-[acyl-carrier-protein] synthase II